jgi:hypothetical protein
VINYYHCWLQTDYDDHAITIEYSLSSAKTGGDRRLRTICDRSAIVVTVLRVEGVGFPVLIFKKENHSKKTV